MEIFLRTNKAVKKSDIPSLYGGYKQIEKYDTYYYSKNQLIVATDGLPLTTVTTMLLFRLREFINARRNMLDTVTRKILANKVTPPIRFRMKRSFLNLTSIKNNPVNYIVEICCEY